MVLSQVANGVLLPFVLIFVLLLINDRELMGAYTNSRWYNVISWLTVGIMIVLTIAMVIAQARG
jgi:Mn2+/Fe2+ NRAMP family transporter